MPSLFFDLSFASRFWSPPKGRSGFALQAWIEQASIGAGPLFRSINARVSLVELPARPDVVRREPATRVRMLYLQVSTAAL
jgi:hypothetical protein